MTRESTPSAIHCSSSEDEISPPTTPISSPHIPAYPLTSTQNNIDGPHLTPPDYESTPFVVSTGNVRQSNETPISSQPITTYPSTSTQNNIDGSHHISPLYGTTAPLACLENAHQSNEVQSKENVFPQQQEAPQTKPGGRTMPDLFPQPKAKRPSIGLRRKLA